MISLTSTFKNSIKNTIAIFILSLILFPAIAKEKPAQAETKTTKKEANSRNYDKQASTKNSQTVTKTTKLKNLDELLNKIKQDQIAQKPELKKREQEFLKARNKQKALLGQAKTQLRGQEILLTSLQKQFAEQDATLSQLEEKLALAMGALGELFGVVKQTAGETKALFENSVISAEYTNRTEFMSKMAAKKNLPNTSDLEKLWFLIQQEMTESGKITRFKKDIVTNKGKTKNQNILRIGSFNLVSQGKYLIYDRETKRITELARQPSRRFLSLVKKLEKSKPNQIKKFGIDPSRGSLLSLLIQTPSFFERISQGGLIGYIILVLLLAGLILSFKLYLNLKNQDTLLHQQINQDKILDKNPLGEVLKVFLNFKDQKQEILELKMEEIIMKQSSQLKNGISTIKLLAGIAPLLGLLGTVTGMIATFQSITLFGTGDPKLMAGGISQALITTVLGLTAAIPLVFIHSYLSNKAGYLIKVFEEQSIGILSRKYKENKEV